MAVITHGCRSNLAEQDTLDRLAPEGAIVINSCAVTAKAVRDARHAAKKAAASGQVYVTGCAAEVAPERFRDLNVTIVPNLRKLDPAAWGRTGTATVASTRLSRGFLAIQDGCDHHCTFCVTRIARGKSRSARPDDVVARARAMVASGIGELVLTGIDTTSYGLDLDDQPTLGGLVGRLLDEVPGLRRLRLSSLDAAEMDDRLLELYADERMMPHVHLSLQSGNNLILKRMRRRHSREEAIRLVERLKAVRPDIAIGADLIAGFPTETEEAHAESVALLDECDVVHAHVFPFSPRPGTPAACMPQLPSEVRKARAAALRTVAAQRQKDYLQMFVGQNVEVVSEGRTGLARHGMHVHFREVRPRGAVLAVRVAATREGALFE